MKWKNVAGETCVYFITGTITEWLPLLAEDVPRGIVLQDLEFYRRKYDARIAAYVIMPEHYHVVLCLSEADALHGWLRDFHGHTANEVSRWLRGDAGFGTRVSRGIVDGADRSGTGVSRNIGVVGCAGACSSPRIAAMVPVFERHANGRSRLAIWKEQARAFPILTESVLRAKVDYIHNNPVRRELVGAPGEWPWSSWLDWEAARGPGEAPVQIEWVE